MSGFFGGAGRRRDRRLLEDFPSDQKQQQQQQQQQQQISSNNPSARRSANHASSTMGGSALGALDEYGQDAYGTDLAEARMDMLFELEDVLRARRRDSWVVTYAPPPKEEASTNLPIWSTFGGGEGGGGRRSRSSSFDFSSAFMESLDAERGFLISILQLQSNQFCAF